MTIPEIETQTFVLDREVLEGMLDRARRGDDNDEIIQEACLDELED